MKAGWHDRSLFSPAITKLWAAVMSCDVPVTNAALPFCLPAPVTPALSPHMDSRRSSRDLRRQSHFNRLQKK